MCLYLPPEEPWGPGDAPTHGGVQEPIRPEWLPHRPRRTTIWGEDNLATQLEYTASTESIEILKCKRHLTPTLGTKWMTTSTIPIVPFISYQLFLSCLCAPLTVSVLSRLPSWEEWNSSIQVTTAAVLNTWRKLSGSTSKSMTSVRPTVKGSLHVHQTVTSMRSL